MKYRDPFRMHFGHYDRANNIGIDRGRDDHLIDIGTSPLGTIACARDARDVDIGRTSTAPAGLMNGS